MGIQWAIYTLLHTCKELLMQPHSLDTVSTPLHSTCLYTQDMHPDSKQIIIHFPRPPPHLLRHHHAYSHILPSVKSTHLSVHQYPNPGQAAVQ